MRDIQKTRQALKADVSSGSLAQLMLMQQMIHVMACTRRALASALLMLVLMLMLLAGADAALAGTARGLNLQCPCGHTADSWCGRRRDAA